VKETIIRHLISSFVRLSRCKICYFFSIIPDPQGLETISVYLVKVLDQNGLRPISSEVEAKRMNLFGLMTESDLMPSYDLYSVFGKTTFEQKVLSIIERLNYVI